MKLRRGFEFLTACALARLRVWLTFEANPFVQLAQGIRAGNFLAELTNVNFQRLHFQTIHTVSGLHIVEEHAVTIHVASVAS